VSGLIAATHPIELGLGGGFAGPVFLELPYLANGVSLLLAQADQLSLGKLGALPGGEQLRVLDRAALSNHPLPPGLFFGPGAGGAFLGELALAARLLKSAILGGADSSTDRRTRDAADGGAGKTFTGLVSDDAADECTHEGAGTGSTLGLRRIMAGAAGGKQDSAGKNETGGRFEI